MPRTKEQNKEIREATRQSIIDNALKLFAKKGFHGTSINDISKAAGISKGLVYNYFESKEDIHNSILSRFLDESREIADAVLELDDPYEQLQQIIDFTFSMMNEKEEEWRFLSGLMMQPVVTESKHEFGREFNKILINKIVKIFKKIGVKNPEAEAYIFGSIIDGVIFNYLYDKKNYPLKKVLRRFKQKYRREELQ